MDEVFSIGAAFLPFGTLLTGSTIGTDNEKSTKVWTGDAENEPVQLVAYNADGTLPSNQVYDDIVTDVNITAPAIVDITSDNHVTMSFTGDGGSPENISISDATHVNGSPYLTRIYNIDNTTALVIIAIYDSNNSITTSTTKIYKYNIQESTLTSDGIYYNSYYLYPRHIAKINDTVLFIADSDQYIFLDVTNGKVLSNHAEYDVSGSAKKNSGATAFTTALPFNIEYSNSNNGYFYYSYQVGDSIWLLGPSYNGNSSPNKPLKIVKLNVSISSAGVYSCSYNTSAVVTSTAAYYDHMVPDIIEQTSDTLTLLIWMRPNSTDGNSYVICTITNDTATVSSVKTVDLGFNVYNNELPRIMQSGKLSDSERYIIAVNNESYKYGTLCTRKIKVTNNTVTTVGSLITLQTNTAYTSIGTSILIDDDRIQVLVGLDRPYYNTKVYRIYDIDFDTNMINSDDFVIPAVIAYDFLWYPEVIDGTFLCAWLIGSNSYYSVSAAYMDPSDYTLYKRRKNVSTKALAVTSGNIGDTVRLAYEGTYNVPGVASGSIYNTDTSYAIAKKAGVLTVSEPQQQTSKVYYGTYTGDGTKGVSSSTPMSITFPFAPKMIKMIGYSMPNNTVPSRIQYFNVYSNDSYTNGVNCSTTPTTFTVSNGALSNGVSNTYMYHMLSSDGKTYYWYTTNAPSNMHSIYNDSDVVYHYVAFG